MLKIILLINKIEPCQQFHAGWMRVLTEWEDRALNVKFHKAWAPIWLYLIKEDKIRSCLSGASKKIMEIVDTRKIRKLDSTVCLFSKLDVPIKTLCN